MQEPSDRPDNFDSDYKNLFLTGALVDFDMKMNDGEILKAHKTVLIARSPVFFKMLTTDMQEAKMNSIEIPDFDSKTMKELLRFVYYKKVENLNALVFDLIYAAEKYEIAKLKMICCNHIISILSQKNVLDALIVADRMSGMQKLFQTCVSCIAL